MRDFNKGSRFNDRRGGGSFGRKNNSSRPEMHKVICDKCGVSCEVPFRPSSDKPIYCNDCFKGKENSSPRRFDTDRNFSRSRERDREMHKVICDKCGENCEVPFKPSSDKPIYCNNCFAENGRGGKSSNAGNNNSGEFEKQFKMLNEKLDKILKHLQVPTSKSLSEEKKTIIKPLLIVKKKITAIKKVKAGTKKKPTKKAKK